MRTLPLMLWKHLRAISDSIDVDSDERRQTFKAIVVGVFVWMFVFPLKLLVHGGFHGLSHALKHLPSVVYVFPPLILGALVTTWISRNAGTTFYKDGQDDVHSLNVVEGDGLERAISLFFSSDPSFALDRLLLGRTGVDARWGLPTLSLALRKWLATLSTLCSGGSGGLEASVSLIGESLAATLHKPRARLALRRGSPQNPLHRAWNWWTVQDPDDLQTAQLCGISAAIATLLGAPFTGAFFAVEVMYRRKPIIDKLIFALLSALVAFFLTDLLSPRLLDQPALSAAVFDTGAFVRPPIHDAYYYLALLGVTVTLAIVARQFRHLRAVLDSFFHANFPNPWARHMLGAMCTGTVVLIVGAGLYFWAPNSGWHPVELVLGPGEIMVNAAIAGKVTLGIAATALVAKLVATLTTITSGGSAGLLFPTMFFGAMVAAAFAQLAGFEQPVVLVAPAMCASLVSIVNVPLAAILFTVEVFGAAYIVPALIALFLSSVFTHKNSIYRAQREGSFSSRQVMPGISVHRVRVPQAWAHHSIADLQVRTKFGLTVIGMVDRPDETEAYNERYLLNPPPDQLLSEDDELLLLGADKDLKLFEDFVKSSSEVSST